MHTRINPELDFTSAPPETLSAAEERAADHAAFAALPDGPAVAVNTVAYAPAAKFSYAKTSELALQLARAAEHLLRLAEEHKKYVKYDKNDPDAYADKASLTWETPYNVLRELNEDSAESRFVAIEIFSMAKWHTPFRVQPMTDEGCDAVQAYAVAFAKRLAIFLKSDAEDLFELLH
ncbi:hypothetical protein [Comamonas terrigena]|uniref:hypothetical protein n=1 Tax=Comamonas terrigena TaxID=32013 RepID=UPI00289EA2C0|nr:hypothetical protein [Comamonas terrigena]